ncbi:MAG: Type 1 glutamine amidotransferase-like domain-containing protein [Anaerolineales bacterium]
MAIALVGSGEYLPPMEPVDRALISLLGEPARVVCLPTAAGKEGDDRIAYWSELGVDHFTRLGAEVQSLPVTDRKSADDPSLAGRIAKANFIYLSGGSPGYLHACLAGSRTWQAILSVLASGGVLAGCSAGAMVLGERFFGFPGWKTGFSQLPGTVIIPHYDEMPGWMERPLRWLVGKQVMLIGIEGNTALVKEGQRYEVLGKRGVTIWNGKGRSRYRQADQIDRLT